MKTAWLLPAAAVALAIFALSIPAPILSIKVFAQNTGGQQTPPTKKKATPTSRRDHSTRAPATARAAGWATADPLIPGIL